MGDLTRSQRLHADFLSMDISEACAWPGTEWAALGASMHLLPCGLPTIGAGLFCDPHHTGCMYYSVCERHARARRPESWRDSRLQRPWDAADNCVGAVCYRGDAS